MSRHYRARDGVGQGTCLDEPSYTLFEDFELMRVDLGHNIFKIMINSYLNSLKVGFNVIIS